MLSTTISMWLGIAFVGLAVAATILQAWLWGFPMAPDPGGPDPNGKSTAPRVWTHVHRVMGLLFVVIYVVLMTEMIPRLWRYQVELPTRTIIHACCGVTIGVLLVSKIAIIRWFQHFGKALPQIGMMILTLTLILAMLSIPYAVQAHDLGDALEPKNLERVERLLSHIDALEDPKALATQEALERGRQVLVNKCVVCHDLRTILRKPRTAAAWHGVNLRMAQKPSVSSIRVLDAEIGPVTAYLVAITPDLQDSLVMKRKQAKKHAAVVAGTPAKVDKVDKVAVAPGEPEPAKPAPKPAYDDAAAKKLYVNQCSECHELTDVTDYAPQDEAGWREVTLRMITENDAEMSPETVDTVVAYLTKHMGKPAKKDTPAP